MSCVNGTKSSYPLECFTNLRPVQQRTQTDSSTVRVSKLFWLKKKKQASFFIQLINVHIYSIDSLSQGCRSTLSGNSLNVWPQGKHFFDTTPCCCSCNSQSFWCLQANNRDNSFIFGSSCGSEKALETQFSTIPCRVI